MVTYQNCSQYADPSIFELPKTDLASSSSPGDLRLDSPLGIIDVGTLEYALSMGGGCNVGHSKKHYIEIRITDQSNQPVPVRVAPQDNTCPEDGVGLPPQCFVANQFKCEHGKYYIHIPINCSAYRNQATSVYRLLGQLVTVDEKGVETRENKASFNRFFEIAWAPDSCL